MTALLALLSLLIFTPDLTKNDVKRLVEAGISDEVIVAYVRTYGPVEPLSARDLIDLRQANVSEKVLAAMVESSKKPAPAPPGETEESSPPVTYSYPWYYPSGYYYDYYSGPYVWWYLGPGRYTYPYYRYPYTNHHAYPHRYPYCHPYPQSPLLENLLR